jgi:hypothetical protein
VAADIEGLGLSRRRREGGDREERGEEEERRARSHGESRFASDSAFRAFEMATEPAM